MRKYYLFILGLVLFVVILTGFIFYTQGDPITNGLIQHDSTVLSDFASIDSAINSYYTRNGKIPAALSDLNQSDYYVSNLKDRDTGKEYEYHMGSRNDYTLCANFKLSSKDPRYARSRESTQYYSSASQNEHDKGYQCLRREVSYSGVSYPQPTTPRLGFAQVEAGYCTKKNEVQARWTAVANADSYNVILYKYDDTSPNGQTQILDKDTPKGQTSILLSDSKIKQGDSYYFVVSARDSTGKYVGGDRSASVPFMCIDIDPQNKSASNSAEPKTSYQSLCTQTGGKWNGSVCDYGACKDTDISDIYNKGTLVSDSSSREKAAVNYDFCVGNQINEYTCSFDRYAGKKLMSTFPEIKKYTCPNGCKDGACIQ